MHLPMFCLKFKLYSSYSQTNCTTYMTYINASRPLGYGGGCYVIDKSKLFFD